MSATRVFIVDDHEVVREGLKAVLEREPGILVVGGAKDAKGLMESLAKGEVDIVILDISLPGRSGLDILKDLKAQYPKLKVLILSMHPEERFAVRALKAGASGYVNKQSAAEELREALERISSGRKYVSPQLAEQLADDVEFSESREPHARLSDREFEILRLIAMGRTSSQIAEILILSVNTVTNYRSRIFEKMKLKTNADLTRYALEHRLID